jgi:bisphosphoglycerate-independent phosphoglycerate mutase (AlkP superfamily)
VTYVQQLLDKLKELQYGSLALVVGRYYAMDRDKRFERNKIAFEGLVQGIGEVATPETVVEVCLVHVAVIKLPHKFYMYSHSLVSLCGTPIG